MSSIYTYQNLEDAINSKIGGRISSLLGTTVKTCINAGVREAFGEIDFRSAKRKTSISPNLFDDIYDYSCPADLKGIKVIDIIPQINRSSELEWTLTSPEEFDRRKEIDKTIFTLSDNDFVRKLRISLVVDDSDTNLTVSELDSLTSGGGTWTLYGDGTNLTKDSDNYVKGNASINWDISAAGGTTAGIYNSGLDSFDITDYVSAGSVFVWVYITSITNLTNFIIRIGSSSTVYYTKTITTNNESLAFYAGWNLLRFDLSSSTQVGTVDQDACNYVALYMTKDGAKISETDYRFDWLVIKRGAIHSVVYYTKYAWQTTVTYAYKENSTATTDLIVADTEELDIIATKCAIRAAQELRDTNLTLELKAEYTEMKKNYILSSPSEAKLMINTYYNL
jgi:hypothetical protein